MSWTISHALRHEPWLYEVELDEEGWVDVKALLSALRKERREWRQLSEEDVLQVIEAADKQRFELLGGRVRALYGHSLAAHRAGIQVRAGIHEAGDALPAGLAQRFMPRRGPGPTTWAVAGMSRINNQNRILGETYSQGSPFTG